jgi:hypothetical protein
MDQVRNHDRNTVFAVDKDGNAKFRRIKIGITNRQFAQVLEGLDEGDMVVVKGQEALGDGQPLAPTQMPQIQE